MEAEQLAVVTAGILGGFNRSTQHFILNEEMECMQMTRRNGRGFSSAEKTELWDRWQGCESRMAVMSAAWFVEFRQRLPWLLHVD